MRRIHFILVLTLLCFSTNTNAQYFLDQINPGSAPRTNQTIHYNDGSRFYGMTVNGRRSSGRLIQADGIECLGGFDQNGLLDGTVEVTYPAEQGWFKGAYSHGIRHGSGSAYKDGKYYDLQYENGGLVTSIEVYEPRCKGENWYGKTLGAGTPSHPFYGAGGVGTHRENNSGGMAPCPMCNGNGFFPIGGKTLCARCGGGGFIVLY